VFIVAESAVVVEVDPMYLDSTSYSASSLSFTTSTKASAFIINSDCFQTMPSYLPSFIASIAVTVVNWIALQPLYLAFA